MVMGTRGVRTMAVLTGETLRKNVSGGSVSSLSAVVWMSNDIAESRLVPPL
ncbi:hypothetical protein GBAR_LOCUS14476 [Geodia barretti]|uniref:Uncharacterized protein n=1 Tax=Geodia barretti TaxID=519541 RepID=A0AA35S7Q9_GEOBA|nr:hypothetical protein GBAR_LOCUS14476 [Geodia barretti]